jgi:hypothetical protein
MTSLSQSVDGMSECRIVTYTPEDDAAREKPALLRERRQRLLPPSDEEADEIIRMRSTENPAP